MFIVGSMYKFSGDTVTPNFEVAGTDSNIYADDGFFIKTGNTTIEYEHDVVTLKRGCQCKCINDNPLTFEVSRSDVYSPVLMDDLKIKQYAVIRRFLTAMGLDSSELAVRTIAKVAIRWEHKDQVPTEDEVLNNVLTYLKDRVGAHEYSGSTNGATNYYETLKDVLIILFGNEVATAVMSLNPTSRLSVSFSVVFKVFYDDMPVSEYIMKLKNKISGNVVDSNPFSAAIAKMG